MTQGFNFSGLHVKTPLNSKELMCMREISEYLIIPNMCVSEDVCEISLFEKNRVSSQFPRWPAAKMPPVVGSASNVQRKKWRNHPQSSGLDTSKPANETSKHSRSQWCFWSRAGRIKKCESFRNMKYPPGD